MKRKYKVIWVEEKTRRLAKELSGKAGMQMKDYIKLALEKSKEGNVELTKERKKHGFKFGF